jgi:hypothetical protein
MRTKSAVSAARLRRDPSPAGASVGSLFARGGGGHVAGWQLPLAVELVACRVAPACRRRSVVAGGRRRRSDAGAARNCAARRLEVERFGRLPIEAHRMPLTVTPPGGSPTTSPAALASRSEWARSSSSAARRERQGGRECSNHDSAPLGGPRCLAGRRGGRVRAGIRAAGWTVGVLLMRRRDSAARASRAASRRQPLRLGWRRWRHRSPVCRFARLIAWTTCAPCRSSRYATHSCCVASSSSTYSGALHEVLEHHPGGH